MLRWGIMSTGVIAHKFADTLKQMNSEAELVACASRDAIKAKDFANEFGIKASYGSYEELVNDANVDIVYVCTPNSIHFDNVAMCIEAGKNVLCEKPMTTNEEDARKLFEMAKKKGVFIMEAFWITMLPINLKLQQIISEGVIGDIRHIRADYGYLVDEPRRKRKLRKDMGGGALLDIGIYNIGFVMMLLGNNILDIKSSVHMSEYGTDDFENIIIGYKDGATATLSVSIGTKMHREAVIFGSKGSIRMPNFQMAEKMYVELNDGTEYEISNPFEINGFEYQVREATRCIEEGKLNSDIQSSESTINVLRVMDTLRHQWNMEWD